MTYKDPKIGIIDLSTEELPKAQKLTQRLFKFGAWFCGVIGVIGFVVLLFVYDVDFFYALIHVAVFGSAACLGLFVGKKTKKKYYKARADILEKVARGELDLFDVDKFYGVIINNTEIGTNMLGWVRGIDQTSSTTPTSAKFTFTNKTGKEIKYITFGIRAYNAVGDPVECEARDVTLYECKCTGPFAPNGKFTRTLEHAWYNPSIESVKIESAEIIYMDNSTETLTTEQIKCLPKNAVLSDNDSRVVRSSFGQTLMIIAGIIDVICAIGIFTIDVRVFGVLTAISSIAFFIGLKMKN